MRGVLLLSRESQFQCELLSQTVDAYLLCERLRQLWFAMRARCESNAALHSPTRSMTRREWWSSVVLLVSILVSIDR